MPGGHAYTIIDTFRDVEDRNGDKFNLVLLRNPWNEDRRQSY